MSEILPSRSHYLHGTALAEQDRLLRLNRLVNPECLARLRLSGGERILDVGSGLGVFARDMARATAAQVVCIERDSAQIDRCRELAAAGREDALIDVRQGDAGALPLRHDEWGTFDVVHCRFVLEHLPDPQSVVIALARAVRPGGRLVLADDDHDLLRLWPALPAADELWRALIQAFRSAGNDPFVGRKLVAMLALAELHPARAEGVFVGGCAGDPQWDLVVDNLIGVLLSTRDDILACTAIGADLFDEVLAGIGDWSRRRDAALWYQMCWAEGVKRDEDQSPPPREGGAARS